MPFRFDQSSISRRALLRALAGAAGSAALAGPALAQRAEWGQAFDAAPRTITMPRASYATLTASTVQSLERAIQEYGGIVARGGWPIVQGPERLRLGRRNRAVVALRQRLMVTNDLDQAAGLTDVFDSYVDAAVKRFQARHGITADGIVGESSYAALNVPAEVRLRQLETNLVRVRAMSGNLGNRYVVVNIPAAQLEAVEDGVAVSRHIAVVGKQDRPSPVLQAKIVEVNFHPFWTVPASIIRKDLIPLMQKDPEYLTKNKIRIYDKRGRELPADVVNWQSDEATDYMFRQDPGAQNSLGTVRINMPNPQAVYMHDTPAKSLFGEDQRFISSGCVRVQNVRELVTWLLSDTPEWTRVQIEGVVKSGERIDAKLPKPVPVYWVYVTAWANPDGIVQFRDDVYGHDGMAPLANRQ